MTSYKTYKTAFLLLALLLVALFFVNVSLGSVAIDLETVFSSFFTKASNYSNQEYIIQNYRFPKAITAVLVGSGLGISGMLMQTLFRNPLAGPFVLGITSGASLGVALVIMGSSIFGGFLATLLISKWSLVIAASIGSFFVLLTVLLVSSRVRDTMAILIIGLMFGSLTAAIVSVLSYFSSAEELQKYIFWGFGSLGDLGWEALKIFGIIYVLGIVFSIASIKALNSLLLGENYAKSVGLNIKRSRLTIIIATSLLAGTITAFAGPIAFIGLAIPHMTRQIFHTANHKVLLPAVFLMGAIVMLVCDSIAQLPFTDYTLPINAVTTLIGAPVVVWLLVRKKEDAILMSDKNQNIILETNNLSIGYTTKKEETSVASNINIALHQGELVGLVGANGIGKSTLLRTITKVQAPLSGAISIHSKALKEYTSIALAKVLSLVLTETVASKNLSVFELVALGRQPYTNWVGNLSITDLAIINTAISQTNLEPLKQKKCFELSDGQLQKVMIARALAQDTSLIVLDEPTTHLDMYHKAYVLKLLKQLAKDTNKTILFSSHEIDLAIQLCDTLIVMTNEGIISDTPKNLIKQGAFENLFPKDLIVFDENTGAFRVNK